MFHFSRSRGISSSASDVFAILSKSAVNTKRSPEDLEGDALSIKVPESNLTGLNASSSDPRDDLLDCFLWAFSLAIATSA